MRTLLSKLQRDFPELSFKGGDTFLWSPKNREIIYRQASDANPLAQWSLLHEVGHALLLHQRYESDFELLTLEVDAWAKAEELAAGYDVKIDPHHIQDCLDTYRDWLYQRSTCPTCTNCSLQDDPWIYLCHNCGTAWKVSTSRLCRPYRRTQKRVPA